MDYRKEITKIEEQLLQKRQEEATLKERFRSLNEQYNECKAELLKLGIEEKDLQTKIDELEMTIESEIEQWKETLI